MNGVIISIISLAFSIWGDPFMGDIIVRRIIVGGFTMGGGTAGVSGGRFDHRSHPDNCPGYKPEGRYHHGRPRTAANGLLMKSTAR